MQSRYRICIPVARATSVIETVAKLCGAWRRMPQSEIKKLEFGHLWTNSSLEEEVESKLVERPSGLCWAFRHRISDDTDAGLTWVTEVGVVEDEGAAWISIANHIESAEHSTPRPVLRSRTRPRIVVDCIRVLGCLLPLHPVARVLRADEASLCSYVEELQSHQRRYPIVFVSCTNQTDRPITGADALADWLAGVASVVVAENRFTSIALANHLPQSLNCWDGAVRIYWPGFSRADSGSIHRVWNSELVIEYDGSRQFGFREVVLERVSDLLAHRRSSRQFDWAQIGQLVKEQESRRAIEDAKKSGDSEELLKLFEQDNIQLRQQVNELTNEIDELGTSLDRAREVSNCYREELSRASKQTSEIVTGELVIRSVQEAIQWARDAYTDELAFALNSQSDEDTPFEDPSDVVKVFEWLATTYRDAKRGERKCPDLDMSIREFIDASWFWRGGQAEYTANVFSNWYECTYDGHRHQVLEHVGSGKSKKPEQTIRIAFTWLESRQLVLIGYIGQHQKSGKT